MTSDLDNKLFIFNKNAVDSREKEPSKKVKVLEKEKQSMSFRESVKKTRSKSKNSHKTTTSKKREGKVENNNKSQVKQQQGQAPGKSRDTSKFSLKSKKVTNSTAKNPNTNAHHTHSKPTTSSILHGKRLSRKLSFSSRKSTGRVNHGRVPKNVFDGSGSIISSASSASLTNLPSQSHSQGQSMATINTNSFDSAGSYGRSFHKKQKSPLTAKKESTAISKGNESKSHTFKSTAVSPIPVPVPVKNPKSIGESSTGRQGKKTRTPLDLIPSPTHRKVIDNVNSMNNSPAAESPVPASNSTSNSTRRERSLSSKSSKRGRKKSKSRKSHSSSTTTSASHSTKKKKRTKSKKSIVSTKKLFVRSDKNTDDAQDDDPPTLEKLKRSRSKSRSRSGSKTEFEISKKTNNNDHNIVIIPSSSFSKNEKTIITKTMSIPSRQWSSTSTTTMPNTNRNNKRNKLIVPRHDSLDVSDSDDADGESQSQSDRELTNAYAHKTVPSQVSRKTSTKMDKLVTPDVNKLLQDCECYMNWVPTHRKLNNENMQHLIETIQIKYLSPPPTGEFVNEDTLRFEPIEHIANLGALCFFHVELNQFKEASETITSTQTFVTQCLRKSVVPKDYIPSFDYIWDFLRLHGSVREWEKTEKMTQFPEMNLLSFVTNFDKLKPKIRAGIYGVKQFFYKIMGTAIDKQIQILRRVISLDRDYFEWPCSLQMALRQQRKTRKNPPSGTSPFEEMKEELTQSIQAYQIAPNNPRCLLGAIQILTDMTKEKMMRDRKNNTNNSTSTTNIIKWDTIKFGQDLQFQSPGQVAKFVKEQAKKIIKFAFKSINVNMALADILTNSLPPEYRDYPLGKNCLTRTLKFHPECLQANYKLAVYYLTVEGNYRQAEIYFDTAFSLDEKHWPSLLGLIHCMMKYIVLRQDMILEVITLQLENSSWDKNQIATLHFLKGLVLLATSKTKEAFEEFIYAYELNQSVFTFAELPHLQKKYGWPNSSALSFGNIRLEAQYFKEQHLKEKDRDKKMIISVIIRTLDKAMDSDKKSSKHSHKLKSNHNKT